LLSSRRILLITAALMLFLSLSASIVYADHTFTAGFQQQATCEYSIVGSTITVQAGQSGSGTVTVMQTSGPCSTVYLSASAVFSPKLSPTSGTPTFESTLTVTVPAGTATGPYTVAITGTGPFMQVGYVTVSVSMQAQTTAILRTEFEPEVVLQNGVARATVTYLVAFSDLPSGYYLFFGVLYAGTSTFVKGSGTSDPNGCSPIADTVYANSATCAVIPSSSSGTETASFSLTFNATRQYSLEAFAAMADKSSGTELSSSITPWFFTISVTAQTVPSTTTLTSTTGELTSSLTSTTTTESTSIIVLAVAYVIIALPFIVIIGLIVFVVRRRKGKRTGETTAEGLASRPSPAPVPTTEETKFCTTCGVRIPVTTPFCASCGGKQN